MKRKLSSEVLWMRSNFFLQLAEQKQYVSPSKFILIFAVFRESHAANIIA